MQIDLGWRVFKPEAGGGEISVELRPLKITALLLVEPMLGSEEGSPLKRTLQLQQATEHFFPEHVRDLKGLTDQGGNAIDLKAFWEESALYSLAQEIVNELIGISKLDKEEAKN